MAVLKFHDGTAWTEVSTIGPVGPPGPIGATGPDGPAGIVPSLALDDLTDADTTTVAPVADNVLTFDGTNWIPGAVSGGDYLIVADEAERNAIPNPEGGMLVYVTDTQVVYSYNPGGWWTATMQFGDRGVAFGLEVDTAPRGVAFGSLVTASPSGVAFGSNVTAGVYSVAFGSGLTVSGVNSQTFGGNSDNNAAGGVAIGYGIALAATATNSIAIGSSSGAPLVVTTPDTIALGQPTNTTQISGALELKGLQIDAGSSTALPTTGFVLTFDGTKWAPAAAGGGGASAIDDLTDVDTASAPPVVGSGLVWDGTSQWTPNIVWKSWTGTQAEYDALGTYDATTLYAIIG